MKLVCVVAVVVLALAGSAAAHADPTLIECPNSHAHVWRLDQCPQNTGPFGGPMGGGGHCGLICGIGKLLGGLL